MPSDGAARFAAGLRGYPTAIDATIARARTGEDDVIPLFLDAASALETGGEAGTLERASGVQACELAQDRFGLGLTGSERSIIFPARTVADFVADSGLVLT